MAADCVRSVSLRALFLLVAASAGAALADDAPAPGNPAPKEKPAAKEGAAKDAGKGAPAAAQKPAASNAGSPAESKSGSPGPGTLPVARTVETPETLDAALRLLSRRRVDVSFDNATMDEAVDFVGRIGRLNTMVSPAFRLKAGSSLPKVTLRLRDVSLRQFAELVARTTGSKLAFKDGILQFTTPEDARGEPVLHIYSIQELTFRIRNFPGPEMNLHVGGGAQIVQEEESEVESPFDDPEHIVDLIKKMTGTGTWEDEGVSISADQRKLVVKQYAEVHREIGRLIAVLRAAK